MMGLKEQILSFLFSFIYGIIVFICYRLSYKYLYYSKKIYCFLNSFLFVLDLTIIYFKIFYIINGGIINIYFILITLLVSIFLNIKFTKKMSKKI